ncbi:MAG: SIS domain-containing protein [Lachnospiraceae bacterium]|nr:SIS domain-containing protein [Lachnospiraceae bacterium]
MLDKFIEKHNDLLVCKEEINSAYQLLCECYSSGGKVLIAGNGGSSSDAEHIVGELMKGFLLKRELKEEERNTLVALDETKGKYLEKHLQGALPAISLSSHSSLTTAISNDVNGDMIFAQQVQGYGRKGDVFLALSTSGNSRNVILAAIVAKAKGMKVVGLTGTDGGELAQKADVCIKAPSKETYEIQEYHIVIYHFLCLMLEKTFFE